MIIAVLTVLYHIVVRVSYLWFKLPFTMNNTIPVLMA